MMTMNISLPATVKEWVEGQSQTGRYSNSSDYVRDLIRRDQERINKISAMQGVVTEALESSLSPHGVQDLLAIARRKAGVGQGAAEL